MIPKAGMNPARIASQRQAAGRAAYKNMGEWRRHSIRTILPGRATQSSVTVMCNMREESEKCGDASCFVPFERI